jgi:hypothetical protein
MHAAAADFTLNSSCFRASVVDVIRHQSRSEFPQNMPEPTRHPEPASEFALEPTETPEHRALPPTTTLRRADTHRLLPAKYSPDYESVLTRIADDDEHLQLIFELDNATNPRLQAEEGMVPGITPRELVFHVPLYRIVNAAFTHPNPLGARFSTPQRGAWYAAFSLATAKAEVGFHKSVEYAEINWTEREELQYDDYLADFSASFHDLRPEAFDHHSAEETSLNGDPQEVSTSDPTAKEAPTADRFADCLSPSSYRSSQRLAIDLLAAGSLGIVYPSVRHPQGTGLACFRPSLVSNVRKHSRYKLTWTPEKTTFIREGI